MCSSSLSPQLPISIHALLAEGDAVLNSLFPEIQHFYPRPPRGGRPVAFFISRGLLLAISIHALLAEGDSFRGREASSCGISIHALLAEGDLQAFSRCCFLAQFLSTPSSRRATPRGQRGENGVKFLSTPSSRRATCPDRLSRAFPSISIHALLAEGDAIVRSMFCCPSYFYPRPPRGGRRHCLAHVARFRVISIHALLAEGDG